MKLSSIVGMAAIILCTSLHPRPAAAEDTLTYKNSHFRYRVLYPAGWSLREQKEPQFNTNVTVKAEIFAPGEKGGAGGLSIEALPLMFGKDSTADKLFRYFSAMKGVEANFNSRASRVIANQEWRALAYVDRRTQTEGVLYLRMTENFLLGICSVFPNKAARKKYGPVIEKIIDSFAYVEPEYKNFVDAERGVSFSCPDFLDVKYEGMGYMLPLLDMRYGNGPVPMIQLSLFSFRELERLGITRADFTALDEGGLVDRMFLSSPGARRSAPAEEVILMKTAWRKEVIIMENMRGIIIIRRSNDRFIGIAFVDIQDRTLEYLPVWNAFLESLSIDPEKWISSVGSE